MRIVESCCVIAALCLLVHENCGQTIYEHYPVAELVLSSRKRFFGYMKLIPFPIQGFVVCLGINFKLKLA